MDDGYLVPANDPALLTFVEDVAFSSPSAGAAVVNAGNINGRTAWKIADSGIPYQQWHESKIAVMNEAEDEAE